MNLKLNTERGVYRYKFVPIFQGIKRINKKIAHENLLILKRLCDEAGLKFILFYGSLLGAVREHDFITHDEDIDVVMYKSDMQKFIHRTQSCGIAVRTSARRSMCSTSCPMNSSATSILYRAII